MTIVDMYMNKLYTVVLFSFFMSSSVASDNTRVEILYMQTCYICHGEDGTGEMPGVPDLANNKTLFTDEEKLIVSRLKQGIESPGNVTMPPKGGNPDLSDNDLMELVKYVKRLVK